MTDQILATEFNGSTYMTAPIGSRYNYPATTAQGSIVRSFNLNGVVPAGFETLERIKDTSGNDIFFLAIVPNPVGTGAVLYLYINGTPESSQPVTLQCYFVNNPLSGDTLWHTIVLAWDTTGGTPGLIAALDGTSCTLPELNPDADTTTPYYSYGYWNPKGTFILEGAYSGQSSNNCPSSGQLPYLGNGDIYPNTSGFEQQSITYPQSLWNGSGGFTFPASYTIATTDTGHINAPIGTVGVLQSYDGNAIAGVGIPVNGSATLKFDIAGTTYQDTVQAGSGQNLSIGTNTVPYTAEFTANAPTYSGAVANGGIDPTSVNVYGTYAYPGFWTTSPINIPLSAGTINEGGSSNDDEFVGSMTESFLFLEPFDYVGVGITTLVSCFTFPDGSTRPIGGSGYAALMNPNINGGALMMTPTIYITGGAEFFPFCPSQQKTQTLGVSSPFPNYFTVVGTLTDATSDPFDSAADV